MGIDLYTLLAQIINLLLLIWLLKKFLYLPILKMVDARQALVLKTINEAKAAQKEALRQQEIYTQQVADFDQERFTLLKNATEDAEKLRQNLIKEIQQASLESKRNFQKEALIQKQSFELSAQNIIVENFKKFATNAFKEMADETLSSRMIEQFRKKIHHLSAKEKKEILNQIEQGTKIIIRTDSKLKTEEADGLKTFIGKAFNFSETHSFKFEVNPLLICGIEMQVGENIISWNLSKYLESFDVNMDEAINNLIQEE